MCGGRGGVRTGFSCGGRNAAAATPAPETDTERARNSRRRFFSRPLRASYRSPIKTFVLLTSFFLRDIARKLLTDRSPERYFSLTSRVIDVWWRIAILTVRVEGFIDRFASVERLRRHVKRCRRAFSLYIVIVTLHERPEHFQRIYDE